MIFDYMDKTSSAGDPGTLYQLKCKLNRKDVNEKVTKAFPGCESFLSTVLDGYVVYATMEYFEMAFQMTVPLKICQAEVQMVVLHSLRKLEKWSISLFSLRFSQKQSCWKMHYKQDQSDESQTCYRCRYPGCDKMYVHEKRRNNHEINVHGMRIEDHQPGQESTQPKRWGWHLQLFPQHSEDRAPTQRFAGCHQRRRWRKDGVSVEVSDVNVQSVWKDKISPGCNTPACPANCLADT